MRGQQPSLKTGASARTHEAMSPLRRRMIEDMAIRKLAPKTQQGYIRTVKDFAAFLGRSPDKASFEDVRRFQLHLAAKGANIPILNHTVAALRFFFRITLKRPDIIEHTAFIHEPRKLPVVLSPEEVARLLDAAPGLKYKAALSVAYGAGLRAAEVISLKVGDIDSKRMVIRVEQGKGRKDGYVVTWPRLLELLRAWWRAARPQGLVVSRTRQRAADDDAPAQSRLSCRSPKGRDRQACIAAHLAAQLRHPPSRAEHRYQSDPGAARARPARYHGALYARRHQDDPRGDEPAGAYRPQGREGRAARLKRGARAASGTGGRGYLPRSWTGMAQSQCRPCQPRSAKGDVSRRELPHGGARRTCRALREVRAHPHIVQVWPKSALPEAPGCGGKGLAGCARGRSIVGAVLSRGVHTAGGHRRHRLPEQGRDLRSAVQGLGRDTGHHRRRSQAPRRPYRHHLGAAQLGLRHDPSPPRSYDPARRRYFAR